MLLSEVALTDVAAGEEEEEGGTPDFGEEEEEGGTLDLGEEGKGCSYHMMKVVNGAQLAYPGCVFMLGVSAFFAALLDDF